jgi:hypothetical protein
VNTGELAPQSLLVGELGVQEGHDGPQAGTGVADRAARLVRVGVVVLELSLSQGTFRLGLAAMDKKLVKAFANFLPDRTTCSGTVRVSDSAPIVTGSGTGLYRNISGSLTLTIAVLEVDAKANCSPSSAFLSQEIVISGSGQVTLGRL